MKAQLVYPTYFRGTRFSVVNPEYETLYQGKTGDLLTKRERKKLLERRGTEAFITLLQTGSLESALDIINHGIMQK